MPNPNESHVPTEKQYTVESGHVIQDDDMRLYVDLMIKPPVEIGEKLGDYLNGEPGEMSLHTLSQKPEFSHIELRTSARPGRLVRELGILVERLDEYLNTAFDSPEELRDFRYRDIIRDQAEQERRR